MLWWIGLTIVGAWLLAKTRFGNWIYSAGGEPTAARNVGVPGRPDEDHALHDDLGRRRR